MQKDEMVQAAVDPAANDGAVNVSVSPIDALEAARAAHMARLPGEPAFKLDPAEISTAEIDGQSWLFLRADKLIELARDFIAAKHRIGDRTNDGSETDGSLNQSLPSALLRKDVEGAAPGRAVADQWYDRVDGSGGFHHSRAELGALIDAALSAERSRVIEECAKVAENWIGSDRLIAVSSRPGGEAGVKLVRAEARQIAAAIRALDKGGAND